MRKGFKSKPTRGAICLHATPASFSCTQCLHSVNRKDNLKRHVTSKHPAIIQSTTNVDHILQNAEGLSFFHDPSIPEEPYESIFNWGPRPTVTWEPTAQDDVAANLDQLNVMLQAATTEQPADESTVEIEVVPTIQPPETNQICQHKCELCNFHHISSVALAAHQKALHPARCCSFCGKVIYRESYRLFFNKCMCNGLFCQAVAFLNF